MKWYLTGVLLCISLMINDTEHLFMCLVVIYISSLEKYLFKSFVYFFKQVGFLLLLSCGSSSYILVRYVICKYFLPFYVLSFHSVDSVLTVVLSFNNLMLQIIII